MSTDPPLPGPALHDEPGYVIAAVGSVILAVTREPPTLAGVAALDRAMDRLLKKHDSLALVIVPAAPKPRLDRVVGSAIIRCWKKFEGRTRCSAVVIRSGGFVGSVQRSLVTTVMSARQRTVPTKVVSDVAHAVEWVQENSEEATPDLARQLNSLVERAVSLRDP